MALINCPECEKKISSKAISCPACGYPMDLDTEIVDIDSEEILEFPELPTNLDIGKQINWGGVGFKGKYNQSENVVHDIPNGRVNVIMHTHGLNIMDGLTFYPIHNSQIISIKQTSQKELIKADKSVIGRAVVGGLILGPLGAIVGGMSGIGSKEKMKNQNYLVINFWDVNTEAPQTLLISGNKITIEAFIDKHEKEKTINEMENREPVKDEPIPIGVVIAILAMIIVALLLIYT